MQTGGGSRVDGCLRHVTFTQERRIHIPYKSCLTEILIYFSFRRILKRTTIVRGNGNCNVIAIRYVLIRSSQRAARPATIAPNCKKHVSNKQLNQTERGSAQTRHLHDCHVF